MTATVNFIQDALAFAQQQPANDQFADIRQQGQSAFAAMPFPTRKTEEWKYTNLRALTQANFQNAASEFDVENAQALFAIDGLDAIRLVYVNGQLNDALSHVPNSTQGLTLMSFADALSGKHAEQQALIEKHLAKTCVTNRNLFTALNNGAVNDGLLLHVAKNQRIEQPVHVVHLTSQQPSEASVFARHLIVLDTHAEATVIEHFVSTQTEQNVLLNQVSEVVVGDGAKLNHYRIQTEHESAIHLGAVHVDLNRDSQFESYQLALGSKVKRLDVVVNHNVSGSHCEMAGVYLPKHEQQVDFHTYIEHKAPHCTTNEVYRGIMADKAKAVFNGRIHIHPDAQKTLAELSNKNLLLSNQAEINTKPELEIYADDVRCAHGATVAQLDEKARFYLQSRGVSRQEAEVMLSFGFINELLDSMPVEALRNHVRPMLAQQFTTNKALTKHLVDETLSEQAMVEGSIESLDEGNA